MSDTFTGLPGVPGPLWAPATTPAPGHDRCGCDGTRGDSCPSCTGESGEDWQQVKARRDEVRQQWRAGQLTARQYYALSAAVSSDGMPSRDAIEALARTNREETRGSAA